MNFGARLGCTSLLGIFAGVKFSFSISFNFLLGVDVLAKLGLSLLLTCLSGVF